jgi:uncharacterized membrane protein (DUF4010 family)
MTVTRAAVRIYWKPFLVLFVLFAITHFVPARPLDPWGLLNAQKVLRLVFALALCQVLGDLNLRLFGARGGSLVLGFFGGLVSSTALTASISKESQDLSPSEGKNASLAILTATLAMHLEAFFIVFTGTSDFHPRLLWLFSGPLLAPILLAAFELKSRNQTTSAIQNEGKIDFRSVLKLTLFILVALSGSKILEFYFGSRALLLLTFFVSLFEIHGSIIANVQLHDAGFASVELLGDLLALSFAASYISKFFLVFTLGSSTLKSRALRWTVVIGACTLASWLMFRFAGR